MVFSQLSEAGGEISEARSTQSLLASSHSLRDHLFGEGWQGNRETTNSLLLPVPPSGAGLGLMTQEHWEGSMRPAELDPGLLLGNPWTKHQGLE